MVVVNAGKEGPLGKAIVPTGCGITGLGETGWLAMAVVAAQVERSLRKFIFHPAAGSLPSKGRDALPCRGHCPQGAPTGECLPLSCC